MQVPVGKATSSMARMTTAEASALSLAHDACRLVTVTPLASSNGQATREEQSAWCEGL